mmetsp:Transcript_54451/g.132149  ORF Transcript_54451/g.132149 Transcript_54451/m.132149 type:complete len:313 (+) Transcript_54451:491-1429(+)
MHHERSPGMLASGVVSSSSSAVFAFSTADGSLGMSFSDAASSSSPWGKSSFFSSTTSETGCGSSFCSRIGATSSSGSIVTRTRSSTIEACFSLRSATASVTLSGQATPLMAMTWCPTFKLVLANLESSLTLLTKIFPGCAVDDLKEIPSLGGSASFFFDAFLRKLNRPAFLVSGSGMSADENVALQTRLISSPPGAPRIASAASLGVLPTMSIPAASTTIIPGTNSDPANNESSRINLTFKALPSPSRSKAMPNLDDRSSLTTFAVINCAMVECCCSVMRVCVCVCVCSWCMHKRLCLLLLSLLFLLILLLV